MKQTKKCYREKGKSFPRIDPKVRATKEANEARLHGEKGVSIKVQQSWTTLIDDYRYHLAEEDEEEEELVSLQSEKVEPDVLYCTVP